MGSTAKTRPEIDSLVVMSRFQGKLDSIVNRKIGRAMHDYSMLADGDRVMVAVSGGVDSLVLAAVLQFWRSKAPINYDLIVYHVDHGFHERSSGAQPTHHRVSAQLGKLGLDVKVVSEWVLSGERTCFTCARNRRSQLFDLARSENCSKIALGHHKDDLIETLFLNIVYGGNISTMLPKQELFNGKLHLLRPLAYIEKDEVLKIASSFGLEPVKNLCPLADTTRRDNIRDMLARLYEQDPNIKNTIFGSLSNVRREYLL